MIDLDVSKIDYSATFNEDHIGLEHRNFVVDFEKIDFSASDAFNKDAKRLREKISSGRIDSKDAAETFNGNSPEKYHKQKKQSALQKIR